MEIEFILAEHQILLNTNCVIKITKYGWDNLSDIVINTHTTSSRTNSAKIPYLCKENLFFWQLTADVCVSFGKKKKN